MTQPVKPPMFEDGSTIRVVSARTGLAMETLRAWERRYGFPRPQRRPGSNRRLYSESDVERLVAIRAALDAGYRVGDVIGKNMPELAGLADRASARPTPIASDASGAAPAHLVGLLERDAIGELEAELRRSASLLGPRRFVTDLAHPFAVQVGNAWSEGRIEVRHEHIATECLVTQLRYMLSTFQDIDARPRVLLATFPGEPHTLALQMVALFLFAVGAKPRLLGAATPPDDLAEGVRRLGADVVGLTVTPSCDLRQARRDVASLVRKLPAGVPIWIGGGGAPELKVDGERARVLLSWDAIGRAVDEARMRGGRA